MINSAKPVSAWLFLCCAMIFIMVAIGGVTRLTESGLSITQWKPVTGIIPPLNDAEWQAEFSLYQQIPEYQLVHKGMTLDEYKNIYFWEYLHRLWGRLIGVVFALPLIYFWMRGKLQRDWKVPLVILFLLGLNQGFLGWYMVQSGLSVNTDVSQYRLTAHLTLAATIYAYMLWIALHIRNFYKSAPLTPSPKYLRGAAIILFALFWLTFVMGGFMAGTNAGLLYTTFPQFNGEWAPGGMWEMQPWYMNLFENTTTIHAVHRFLASALVIGALSLMMYGFASKTSKKIKVPLIHVGVMSLIQMALGISTIARGVPVALGAAHQAGAILLLTFFVWLLFNLRKV
ncbi:MAG: heme A synthase [Alphaproteobacteria bacterium]|nr:MAG: heme A synthase [Alphaproteobacteria bacterium]